MAATSKRSGKAPSTRQLVNDAERMLGRTPQSNAPFIVGVALVLAAVGVAVMLLV